MAKFEEVQMKIAETAGDYLKVYNMQVFTEQFTLQRESVFSLTLKDMEPPYYLSALVSFSYNVFQTGMTLYDEEDTDDLADEPLSSFELEFLIKLPIMRDYPDMENLLEEINERYADTNPVLITREIFPSDNSAREYEIAYSYDIDADDASDTELYDEVFEELRGILSLIHRRTMQYIDTAWYQEDD
ncbi:MAG: hypothetical protein L0Y62_00790 [Nitrospirae bacterium]|nr:hypothetical protein [Nitrospirota bacterium]